MKTMAVSTQDLNLIAHLKQTGALRDVEPGALLGVSIFVACSDGHRFNDLYNFQCKTASCDEQHVICGAGGPIVGTFSNTDTLAHEIGGAVALGKGDSVALYAHFPCGMARLSDVGIVDVFDRLCKVAPDVRNIEGVRKVVKHFHYFDGHKHRTLSVHRESMMAALLEMKSSDSQAV